MTGEGGGPRAGTGPKMPEPGPLGRNLIANAERLRQARGLSYRRLSAELGKAGRPVFPLGLSRMARGERRMDVDDAAALARVLGVTLAELLAPPPADTAQAAPQDAARAGNGAGNMVGAVFFLKAMPPAPPEPAPPAVTPEAYTWAALAESVALVTAQHAGMPDPGLSGDVTADDVIRALVVSQAVLLGALLPGDRLPALLAALGHLAATGGTGPEPEGESS